MVSVSHVLPRHVVAADSTVVSCGLTNFQRTPFQLVRPVDLAAVFLRWALCQTITSFRRASRPVTRSCALGGPSLFMIHCRPFRGNVKTLRSHVGCHPQIIRSVVDADDYGDVHRGPCQKLDWIMICKSIRPTLSCGPRHWRDSVVSLTSDPRCIFVNTISGEALVGAHVPSAAATALASSRCFISGSLTSASILVLCRVSRSNASAAAAATTHLPLSGSLSRMWRQVQTVKVNKNVVRSPSLKRGRSCSETPSRATAAPSATTTCVEPNASASNGKGQDSERGERGAHGLSIAGCIVARMRDP